jgi:hypothetical protein
MAELNNRLKALLALTKTHTLENWLCGQEEDFNVAGKQKSKICEKKTAGGWTENRRNKNTES